MRRYRFIAAEQVQYPVALLCRVLGVARSGYDAWARRGVSARAAGERTVCGRRRVARLMRAAGLVGRRRRALADHLLVELTLDALGMALAARRPAPGLVHHTDRGGPYTAAAYAARLAAHGLVISMSRAGDGYDNAMAESFFATRKAERSETRPWPTRRAAQPAIFAWIEVYSTRQRSHSALGYRSPVAFEQALAEEEQAA